MLLRLATPDDRPAWDAYVLGHPDGVAYQLFGWKVAVEEAYRFKCPYLLAEEEGEVRGVLPLVHLRLPFSKGSLISLPYCDVAGPLADSGEVAAGLLEYAQTLASERGAKGIEVRAGAKFPVLSSKLGAKPQDAEVCIENREQLGTGNSELGTPPEAAGTRNAELGPPASGRKVRMLLDLPGSSDALMASFPSKLRSQVRKPEKDGLTVKVGGPELVDDFYRVFAENMRDLGSPVHSRRWVEGVVSGYEERCRVGVVRTADGSPAAAGVILLHSRTVSIPWASSLRRLNRSNPNMLLYWAFLSFAADAEFEAFDFGRSTPGEGTYRFKEQWGAKPEPLEWVRAGAADGPGESVALGRKSRWRGLAERAYSRLSVPAATAIGGQLRKYVSL